MKSDTICCCCISKHMTEKGTAESLHVYITRVRLTKCEVGILSIQNVTTLENSPTHSLRSCLCSSPMGVFLRDYGIRVY